MTVYPFFDPATHTISYVVSAQSECIVIDPVLDYDTAAARISTHSVEKLINFIEEKNLSLRWILETHIHADHFSAAQNLKRKLGGKLVIGRHVVDVQDTFARLFNFSKDFKRDGSQFDRMLAEGDTLAFGDTELEVIETPGHTPACISYAVEKNIFVGDTLFMPDYGCARCDFPGGDAELFFDSIQKYYQRPDDTKLWFCHDYLPKDRDTYCWQSTVGEQKRSNIMIQADTKKADFVAARRQRDSELSVPDLMLTAVQFNISAGSLPAKAANGISYFSIPINQF